MAERHAAPRHLTEAAALPLVSGDPAREAAATRAFIAIENRDAYATIRGFVYQVERTIDAWIDLDDGTVLFCESGEDIDFVQALASPGDPWRLLEQIKHREQSLSLRSPAVIDALANYFHHRTNNSRFRVRYRFFTNAAATAERDANFPDGRNAIESWIAVATGELTGRKRRHALREIRRLLTAREAAEVVDSQTLVAKAVASTRAADLLELIQNFEFSMRNPNTTDLRRIIESRLIEKALAQSQQEAQQLYEKLFVRVFETIGQPGEKRLDRPMLDDILGEGTLVFADRRLLVQLQELLKSAAMKFSALEEQVADIRTDLDARTIAAPRRLSLIETRVAIDRFNQRMREAMRRRES